MSFAESEVCPQVFNSLDILAGKVQCKAICPNGWVLVRDVNPQTGIYICQNPQNPNQICKYFNPVCKTQSPTRKLIEQTYKEVQKNLFWHNLGAILTDVAPEGLDFPSWWIKVITLEPDASEKIVAYWGELNKKNTELAQDLELFPYVVSELLKALSFTAFALSVLAGIFTFGPFVYRKYQEALKQYKPPIQYVFSELKTPLFAYFLMVVLFATPLPRKIETDQGEIRYFYPIIVDWVRDLLLFTTERANDLSHRLNMLLIEHSIHRLYGGLEWKLKNTQLLEDFHKEEFLRYSQIYNKCVEDYGIRNFRSVNNLDDLSPLSDAVNPPDPYTCYYAQGYRESEMKKYLYYSQLEKYYKDLLQKVIEAGFKDKVIKRFAILENQLGWLSTPVLYPLMRIEIANIAREEVKDNLEEDLYEKLMQVQEEYIRLTGDWKKQNPPPWYRERGTVENGFAEDTGLLGSVLVYITRIGVLTSLPPGSFIDKFLDSLVLTKDKEGRTKISGVLMKIMDTIISVASSIFPVLKGLDLAKASVGTLLTIGVFIVKKLVAYYVALAILAFLPLFVIVLATLFRFAIYTWKTVTMVISIPFIIFKAIVNRSGEAFLEFGTKVLDLSLFPFYLLAMVGISFLVVDLAPLLLYKLPDIFLEEFYEVKTAEMFFANPLKVFLFLLASSFSALSFYLAQVASAIVVGYMVYSAPDIIKEWSGEIIPERARAQIITPLKEKIFSRIFPF